MASGSSSSARQPQRLAGPMSTRLEKSKFRYPVEHGAAFVELRDDTMSGEKVFQFLETVACVGRVCHLLAQNVMVRSRVRTYSKHAYEEARLLLTSCLRRGASYVALRWTECCIVVSAYLTKTRAIDLHLLDGAVGSAGWLVHERPDGICLCQISRSA
jgi:hypothetical protein